MKRLRIAVLNRVFSVKGGGAETYSIRIVEQLAARHEVHVFAQRIEHEWPGVTYHRIAMPMEKPRWINQLWYAWATWRATRTGFDVVHSHENTWHGQIQTIHVKPVRTNLFAGRSGLGRMLRWVKVATSPRMIANLSLESARFRPRPARHVVLASETLRVQAALAYPEAASMMSVITPGVTLPADEPSRTEARRALGLPLSGVLLLFVANNYARKGLDALLAAMPRLPEGAMLMVVGNAREIPEFKQRAGKLGLEEHVHFLGAMKDIGLAYRAATALAHPTHDDTFAMVVLEAMSYGVPVVVSGPAYCGIAALLRDGEDALLLEDPRNESELAAALNRILGDAELAGGISQRGRAFAQQHTWEEAARRYEALYVSSGLDRDRCGGRTNADDCGSSPQ